MNVDIYSDNSSDSIIMINASTNSYSNGWHSEVKITDKFKMTLETNNSFIRIATGTFHNASGTFNMIEADKNK